MSKSILILSQVYVPDPASVGQHMHDAAAELARRGWNVQVVTSRAGYDDPTRKYEPREERDGVHIRRLPFSSFGKKNILLRILGTASFALQAIFAGLFTRNVHAILFSTSPPLIGAAVTIVRMFRRVPTVYWAMDLNPDQLIALGKIKEGDLITRLLESINKTILHNSTRVIALDRFMAARLEARAPVADRMSIIPPWPHEKADAPLSHDENHWRKKHELDGKFVIMYSGNHSPSNPLDTLLEATRAFKDDDRIRFLFVGGGLGKKDVEAFIKKHGAKNVISLPYQPIETLRYSLSAGDVHVVSLGDDMVGIIHPCKVYGSMAVGRPVLFFGPRPSHVSDLLDNHDFGKHVSHGDVDAAVNAIRNLADASEQRLADMGAEAQRVLRNSLSQDILCAKMIDDVEATVSGKAAERTEAATA
ncbi:MAG: glycosyltransferase family 4 protein [Planctomycetota bacterium]